MDLYSITNCEASGLAQVHDFTSGLLAVLLILAIGLGLLLAALVARSPTTSESEDGLASYRPLHARAGLRTALWLIPASVALGALLMFASQQVSSNTQCTNEYQDTRVVRRGVPAHFRATLHFSSTNRETRTSTVSLLANLAFWSGLAAVGISLGSSRMKNRD